MKVAPLLPLGILLLSIVGCSRYESSAGEATNVAASSTVIATSTASTPPAVAEFDPAEEFAETPAPPPNEVIAQSVKELKQKPAEWTPELRSAMEANSEDWPASFFATFTTPLGSAVCTSALVGPSALLTAAHCVPPSGIVRFKFNKIVYSTVCSTHPDYMGATADPSADFALCKLDVPFSHPAGFRYESIETLPTVDLIGRLMVLTGYGCTSDAISEGAIDGKYRIGRATILETSSSKSRTYVADYYEPKQKYNLITARDGSNLCPGDSGGPAFRITDGVEKGAQYPNRVIIGVNSRVFKSKARNAYGASLVSATSGPAFRSWAEGWAANNRVAVCGVAGTISNCRGGGA